MGCHSRCTNEMKSDNSEKRNAEYVDVRSQPRGQDNHKILL